MTLNTDNSQAKLYSIFLFCAQYLWWCDGLSVNVSFQLVISIFISTWYVTLDIDNSQAELCLVFLLCTQYL